MIKKFLLQIFCNHHQKRLITKLDANYIINKTNNHNLCKTYWVCERCSKILTKKLEEDNATTIGWNIWT